jgi:hypothetical protein
VLFEGGNIVAWQNISELKGPCNIGLSGICCFTVAIPRKFHGDTADTRIRYTVGDSAFDNRAALR